MTPAVLARTKELVDPALRSAVDGLDEHLQAMASYHFGWTTPDGAPDTAGSGKGIRSALAVLGSEAVGGDASHALPGAVAVELIHNFSLIHDDIMDGDRLRRHRRTLWDVFSIGDAIIVGDALHALAFQVLLAEPLEAPAVAATARLARATSAMIDGQSQDVALDKRDTATLAECLAMEANKTGALLAHSVAIGGVLGGGDPATVDALEDYGSALGLAFQAVDDVLGIWGDPAVTGKAVGNDLREQKKSMPIAVALDHGGEIAERVQLAYRSELSDFGVDALSQALAAAGIKEEVQSIARRYLSKAINAVEQASLDEASRTELVELANFVVTREL